MRKYAYMFMAAALSVFASCENQEVEAPVDVPVLAVTSSQALFPAEGGTGTVVVEATGSAVSAETNKDWLSVSVSGNTVTLTATENKNIQSRYALVTIKSGEAQAQVTAQQLGYQTATISLDDILSDSNTHTYRYPYTYAGTISLTSTVSWLAATAVEDASGKAIEVAIEENREGKTRYGQILWQLGMEEGVINVTQYLSLAVDASWTLAYLRDQGVSSILEVSGPATSYAVGILSKSAFSSQYGSSYEQFALETAAAHDKVFDAAGEITWSLLASGTYAAVIVGVDESGEPTGSYNYFELTVQKQSETSMYEAWLGKWTSVGSDGTTMEFTITQDVKEESYFISGFADYIDPVPAGYDPATGNLWLKFYDSDKMLGSSYYLYIVGVGDNDYVAFGDEENEILGIVSLTSETTAVAKGHSYDYTFEDGEQTHYNVLWMGMFGYGANGWTYFTDIDYIYFPANWTKTENGGTGGGGGGDNPGTSAYDKWIGSWNTTLETRTFSGGSWGFAGDKSNDVWTFTQGEKDKSYIITKMYDMNVNIKATFNSDGTISLPNGQESVGKVRFQGDDYDCDLCLYGTYFDVSGSAYRISGNYDICYAELTSDKAANLLPESIQVSGLGDGNIDLSCPRLYALDPMDGKYYTFDGYEVVSLPNTMTKSGNSAPRRNVLKTKGAAVPAVAAPTVAPAAKTFSRKYEVPFSVIAR